jgi:dihydroorotase
LSVNGPAYDLPTCMSKFLFLGMPLRDVVRAATSRPAEILGIEHDAGTLRPGSRADLALFHLHEGRFPLYDIWGTMREGRQLLASTCTIVGGRPLRPLPAERPAPWAEDPVWPEALRPFTKQQELLRSLGHTPAAMAAAAQLSQTGQ